VSEAQHFELWRVPRILWTLGSVLTFWSYLTDPSQSWDFSPRSIIVALYVALSKIIYNFTRNSLFLYWQIEFSGLIVFVQSGSKGTVAALSVSTFNHQTQCLISWDVAKLHWTRGSWSCWDTDGLLQLPTWHQKYQSLICWNSEFRSGRKLAPNVNVFVTWASLAIFPDIDRIILAQNHIGSTYHCNELTMQSDQ